MRVRALFASPLCVALLQISCTHSGIRNVTSTPSSTMVFVAGGIFTMGTTLSAVPRLRQSFEMGDWAFYEPELPQHEVSVAPFWIDRTEVTNEAFLRFLQSRPEWQPEHVNPASQNGQYLREWRDGSYPAGKGDYPVTYVTWYAAMAYCQSKGGRLPTEAEWEYAASPTKAPGEFPWGEGTPDPSRANYDASGYGAPIAVASYAPNERGIYDLAGNVWEYMLEEWRQDYTKPQVLPQEPLDTVKSRRAIRGGSWGGAPVNLRVRFRDSHPPEGAGAHVGFRCVRPGT
jgi:formylglycine-generating enzyme required for sulfatase activity